MTPEIEQIVSADETARATLQQAELTAEKMTAEAQEKADSIIAALDRDIQEVEEREIIPILEKARNQAQLTSMRADQYIEKLQTKLKLLKTTIADECIDLLLNRNFR